MTPRNPYEVLGVPPDADSDTIKRGFRVAASKAHPDRKGGSDEAMAAVNEAYELLSDPERRAAFDERGETGAPQDIEQAARSQLADAFKQFIDNDRDLGDPIPQIEQAINNAIHQYRQQIRQFERRIATLDKKRRHAFRKKPGHDLYATILENERKLALANKAEAERMIKVMEHAKVLLADYGSEVPPVTHAGGYGEAVAWVST